jgi:hypothetical protein
VNHVEAPQWSHSFQFQNCGIGILAADVVKLKVVKADVAIGVEAAK